jgi:two-component system chemotaxis response regulator CheB
MTQQRAEAIVIGTSAGALDALTETLKSLPRDSSLPIMVVAHLPPGRQSLLAELIGARCIMAVREAEDKEPIMAGVVYFAPPDYHLLVETDRRLSLSSDDPVQYSRPSIDVLFESAAEVYEAGLIGVILTGANSDGAHGLRAIVDAGGLALVQRPDLASSAEMPRAALAACPTARAMSLEQLGAYLCEVVTPQ